MFVRGGYTSRTTGVKGIVAGLEVAEKFLSGQNQITDVMLAGVSLGASINKIANTLPPNIRWLNLDNTLLTEFLSGVIKLKKLQDLYVGMAFVTTNFVLKARYIIMNI